MSLAIKMLMVGTLKEYDPQKESWTSYVERFECYCLGNSVTDDLRVPTFLASMGASAYGIARNLAAPRVPKNVTCAQLKNLLEGHFKSTPLIIAQCLKFHRCDRKLQGSVSDYVLALKDLAATCDFREFLEQTLRD